MVLALCMVVSGYAWTAHVEAQAYIPFTDYLPPLTVNAEEYESGYNHFCRDDTGHINTYQCVDKTIREMTRRYDRLHSSCDHRGIFALAYLLTTEEYQRASLEPGFFRDPEFINHEDVVFAQFYFAAYDAWESGRMADVPPAWRLAFAAANSRNSATSVGDALLGVSAHINRDLPIVLATIGLVDPETGESRKPDHDKVNAFLARVALDPAMQASWDPKFVTGIPGTPLTSVTAALIQTWREAAWRWAELLISARTPEEEANVIAQIEWYAYQQGLALLASNHYLLLQSSASRDAFCMAHR
ncbi:MAG: hypothetical protein KC417_11955 [Myxococcales bacterium]|nr:hypothetical protein [Myxococcales bacterium]